MLWTEKYRPSEIKDLVLPLNLIDEIDEWLNNHTDPLLFIGYPGTGKTEAAKVILNERNYQVNEINSNDIKNNKSIKDILTKSLNTQNICNMLSNNRKKPAIIIDEIDSLLIGSDKSNLNELLELLTPSKQKSSLIKVPIICICNETNDKKISELKRYCKEVMFPKLTKEQLNIIIDRIIKAENMQLSDRIREICIQNSIGDIRRLIIILNDIHNLYLNKDITDDLVERLCNTLSKKDLDVRLYEATSQILLNKDITIDECLLNYNYEKFLLPFMIHENIPRAIKSRGYDADEKISRLANCFDILSENDTIQEYIYEKQAKKLNIYSGIYITYVPNYYINHDLVTEDDVELEYTDLSNKFSQYRANRKTYNHIRNEFPISLDETFMITEHIYYHLFHKNGDKVKLAKMLKAYNIKPDQIPLVLRLNNLSVDFVKKKYTTRIKKDFTTIYNNSD